MSTKLTINDMQKLATKKGGQCLSKRYFNSQSKLKWECEKGHRWEATPSHVKYSTWCPVCGKNRPLTIKEMQEIAKSHGGKCLSQKYINSQTKLKWKCEKGHVWEAVPNSIKLGTWCFICGGKELLTIEEMRKIAESHEGKCLSNVYTNSKTRLKWQCNKGHIWEATPLTVKNQKSWCPVCAGIKPLTITEMQNIAKSRGGKCLSKQYFNNSTKLKWQCANGHVWEAKPDHVKRNRWCPMCNLGTGERITQKIFESIFGKKFPKVKPNWLLNKKGNKMEIDGYCDELKLGFEYQGEQHYKEFPIFQKKYNLTERISDDNLKRKLCKKHGVTLIEIPFNIEFEDLYNFIILECEKNNIFIPSKEAVKIENLEIFHPIDLREMQEIAKSRGGICLSKQYTNNSTKLKWQCARGHIWEARPDKIKLGTWCRTCSGLQLLTIEEMREIAKSHGGKCLSKIYTNTKTKLKWECVKGHIWEATPSNIKRGKWCRKCYLIKRHR